LNCIHVINDIYNDHIIQNWDGDGIFGDNDDDGDDDHNDQIGIRHRCDNVTRLYSASLEISDSLEGKRDRRRPHYEDTNHAQTMTNNET
jgi:hypothetical protein